MFIKNESIKLKKKNKKKLSFENHLSTMNNVPFEHPVITPEIV